MENSLDKLLKDEIIRFKAEAKKHRRHYRLLKSLHIGSTACASTVASISGIFPDKPVFAVLAVALSTIGITAVTFLEMRKSFELWKSETAIYHELCDIQRELSYSPSMKNMSDAVMTSVFNRINSTIRSGGANWQKLQT